MSGGAARPCEQKRGFTRATTPASDHAFHDQITHTGTRYIAKAFGDFGVRVEPEPDVGPATSTTAVALQALMDLRSAARAAARRLPKDDPARAELFAACDKARAQCGTVWWIWGERT